MVHSLGSGRSVALSRDSSFWRKNHRCHNPECRGPRWRGCRLRRPGDGRKRAEQNRSVDRRLKQQTVRGMKGMLSARICSPYISPYSEKTALTFKAAAILLGRFLGEVPIHVLMDHVDTSRMQVAGVDGKKPGRGVGSAPEWPGSTAPSRRGSICSGECASESLGPRVSMVSTSLTVGAYLRG